MYSKRTTNRNNDDTPTHTTEQDIELGTPGGSSITVTTKGTKEGSTHMKMVPYMQPPDGVP